VHDPVRLFRLVRFASRLGYRPEGRTQELFDAALERNYQRYVSTEALGQEVEQIAREENVIPVLKILAEKGLLEVVHPALQKRKPDYDGLAKFQRYHQQAEATGYHPDPFVPVLYYLTKRLQGSAGRKVLRNLGLKKPVVKRVLGIEKEARSLATLLGRRRKISPREVYELLTPVPIGLLVFVLAEYSSKMKVRSKIFNYLFKYRPLRNQLPARELHLMGVAPGPQSDQILEKYFEARLDGKLRDRAQQLRYLQKLAGLLTREAQERESKSAPAPAKARTSRAGRAKKRRTKATKKKDRKASRNVARKRKKAGGKKKARSKARGRARR
jgi:tRNA nucleotidyltransferase (CCA-adding enzyme)